MWTLEDCKISKKIKFLLVSIFLSTPFICLTLYSYCRAWSVRSAVVSAGDIFTDLSDVKEKGERYLIDGKENAV